MFPGQWYSRKKLCVPLLSGGTSRPRSWAAAGKKPVPQNRNVLAPLAQRRQAQTDTADAVIKVFAHIAGPYLGLEFASRPANVTRDSIPLGIVQTDLPDQFRLRGGRQIADFLKIHCSALTLAPGEHLLAGFTGQIGVKGLLRAPREVVNAGCSCRLPGAMFGNNQHRHIILR